MEIIPKYEVFLIRHYKKNSDISARKYTHFDSLNKGQQNFPQNKVFNFISDFENKDVFFEICNEDDINSTNKITSTFDRITWATYFTEFQEKGEPFVVRFFRPTNIDIDTRIFLNDGFNEIWKGL